MKRPKIGHNQNPITDKILNDYLNPILDFYNFNNKQIEKGDWSISLSMKMLEDLKKKLEEGFDEKR